MLFVPHTQIANEATYRGKCNPMKESNTLKKRVIYTEIAYLVAILLLPLGVMMMARAEFGIPMIAAPAYLLHLKLSVIFPWFTFGVAEYVVQGLLLTATALAVRKLRLGYLFSFVTTLVYGALLDLWTKLAEDIVIRGIALRLTVYIGGYFISIFAVVLFFKAYIAPEAYELFVKEISATFGFKLHTVKIIYDYSSCLLGVILSFAFYGFGKFVGVNIGTLPCALLNGWIIALMTKGVDRLFVFKDALPFRGFFTAALEYGE